MNDTLKTRLQAFPNEIGIIYNAWINLYLMATTLHDLVKALSPKLITEEEHRILISLVEKRAFYRAFEFLQKETDKVLYKIENYAPDFYDLFKSDLVSVIEEWSNFVNDLATSLEIYQLIEDTFMEVQTVQWRYLQSQLEWGYSGWIEIPLYSGQEESIPVKIPIERNSELVAIAGIIRKIEANINSISDQSTIVFHRSASIDLIPVLPGAFFDFSTRNGFQYQPYYEEGSNIPKLVVPEDADLYYRLTFPGLMAQPAFWRSPEILEIRLEGDFPSGWEGLFW